jgi:phage terminase small subunit
MPYSNDHLADSSNTVSWDDKVKGRKALFVKYYCTDADCFLNGSRAYLKAYTQKRTIGGKEWVPKRATCASQASRLLADPEIKQAVRLLLQETQDEKDEKSVYEILRLYRTLSLYDTADIIKASGELKTKTLKGLGELSKCVSGIVSRKNKSGEIETEIKLYDRTKAMEAFARYLKLLRPEVQNEVTVPVVIVTKKEGADG